MDPTNMYCAYPKKGKIHFRLSSLKVAKFVTSSII
jgi:hypothetical protein